MRQQRRIGVYGICRDEAGRILLVRGSQRAHLPGVWQIPGGGVDHGEDPADALVREFLEETGLTVAIRRLIGVRHNLVEMADRDVLLHHDKIIYEVEAVGGRLRDEADGTSDVARWHTAEDLAGLSVLPWAARLLASGIAAGGEPEDVAVAVAASAAPAPNGPVTQVQRFAAYGLVRDLDGRILLTRIAPGYPGAGSWHLPGGGTDFGESADQGLARELAEETGQRGEVGALLTVAHFHNPAAYGPEKRPIDWHTVRTVFRVVVADPTEPVVQEQCGSTDSAAWVTLPEALTLNLNKLARSVINDYAT